MKKISYLNQQKIQSSFPKKLQKFLFKNEAGDSPCIQGRVQYAYFSIKDIRLCSLAKQEFSYICYMIRALEDIQSAINFLVPCREYNLYLKYKPAHIQSASHQKSIFVLLYWNWYKSRGLTTFIFSKQKAQLLIAVDTYLLRTLLGSEIVKEQTDNGNKNRTSESESRLNSCPMFA